ncbi:uncharacterized protein LOC133288922 isoform X2 [Gastrolobium bilobum]|uniref:uncharacterized protein LOC133288922 isoform X2 n=1 Tax=Gastrolobium bilobum TaxID=150636 RepID=UPI002AB28665|nr:uncharacterized protein LOC133288922 isoform X2 [Gastrolobium bilobum]
MNQNKQVASLTTTRLSPLAKPFTLNRSSHQPGSMLSTHEPCVYSLQHCNHDDPFSSLLDSFRKTNLASKGDYGFGQDTLTTTLPVETATQAQEKTLLEQHPSLDLPKNGNGSEVSYGQQGVDFHKSLFGKGNDVGSSAADASIFHKGKHSVDGLNPCLRVSHGIFNKSTSTIVAKDILPNSKGSIHTADESSSFHISNCKVAPVKLSTTDMSSAKTTPQNQSSKNLGDNGSEVDSPCWKGTMAFCPTPEESSGSAQFHHVEKATEKHNSLNPRAPQFFPGVGYIKDDFVSSNSSVPVATDLLSGEDTFMKTVMEKSPVELNMGIELRHSSNICGREMAFNMLNDPQNSSVDPVLNSLCMTTQSSSKEDCLTSKGKLVTIVDVDDFVKGTKDPRSSRSISEVFPAKGHSPTPTSTTLSTQVSVVTDLLKTFEGVSKSLIESPKPDVDVMVRAIHVLSELLVQTGVDGVDSCNEHDHIIMIQKIINNLNVFSTKKCGQRIPTLDSTPADSPFCLDRSLEQRPKGLEMTRIETCTVQHQLYPQNEYMGKNRVSKDFGESGQSPFASCSNEGTEKGNEIAQDIRRRLGKKLDFDKQMHPMAFLFWNLWLDSEAEQCYTKYKTYHGLMEAGVDVSCTNVADLWCKRTN